MKAILLTPNHESRTVDVQAVDLEKEPDCEEPTLQALYKHLECSQVQMFRCDVNGMFRGCLGFADEDALFRPHQGFIFCPLIGSQPYAGRILILKAHADGCADIDVDVDVVQNLAVLVYASPRFAAHAMKKHEDGLRTAHPGVIVMDTSSLIFGRITT